MVGSGQFRRFHGSSIPGRKNFRIFLVSSSQIPVISGGTRPEVGGIIQRSSGPEYWFQFPSISEAFLSETLIFPELSSRFRLFPKVGIIGLG
jgi:hypothetical protein